MRLFRATYRDRAGKERQSQKWYLDFKDHLGIRHRIPAYTDEGESKSLGHRIKELVGLRRAGELPGVDLYGWLEDQPEKLLKQFASWGLIEARHALISRELDEHVEDFRESLLDDGCTERHANQKHRRILRVIGACGLRSFSDIPGSVVQRSIRQLKRTVRKKVDGQVQDVEIGPISQQTRVNYLKAFKQFCQWAVEDRRTGTNPLAHLTPGKKKGKVAEPLKTKRRALGLDEVRRLLKTTAMACTRYCMAGSERAALYQTAIETGYRAWELRCLKACNVNVKAALLTLPGEFTKNDDDAVLPLRPAMSEILRSLIESKHPQATLFDLPSKYNMADMIREDLIEAGIDSKDTGDGYLDFHSLRHTTGSLLAATGCHPKVAQSIMRHSDINLTMSTYTHTAVGGAQEAKAVASHRTSPRRKTKSRQRPAPTTSRLIALVWGSKIHPKKVTQITWPPAWPFLAEMNGLWRTLTDRTQEMRVPWKVPMKVEFKVLRLKTGMRALGLEPRTYGLKGRCSTN